MRLPNKTKLRVYPNPWGVSPAQVSDEVSASRRKRELALADHSTMDHEGRPCGGFLSDSIIDGGAPGRAVGRTVCMVNTAMLGAGAQFVKFDLQRQRTVFAYNGVSAHETAPYELAEKLAQTEPVTLPFSEYYADGVRTGELIAADEETAKECGVKFFEPVATLFPKLAQAAAEAFDLRYNGDEGYKFFVGERKKAAEEAAKAAAEAASDASASPAVDASASA